MVEVTCPNDGETMYSLRYQKRKKTKNEERTHGQYRQTDWYWCEKCKKPLQFKIIVSETGFRTK